MIQALILMFVAMSLVPAGDTAGKLLITGFGVAPLFVAWARFVVGAAAMLPFAPRGTFELLRDWRIWGRALMLVGGICCILTALQTAPIASVFAAFFIGPIISFGLSVIWLRETATVARVAMMALGFVGVLLVVRPGFDAAPGLGWAVLAGVFYGIYLTASRALSHLAAPRAMLTSQLLVGSVALAPVAVWYLPDSLTATGAVIFLASGLCSALGNLLLLVAYRMGSASALAPMVYFQLIAATGFGWAVFGNLPDRITWAGLALIIGAGVVSARLGRASFTPARTRADRG